MSRNGYPNALMEYRLSNVNSNTLVKYYHADGQRIAMREGSSTLYYFVSDHLGSTALTLNQNGTVHSETRYKPFGETAWSSTTPPTRRRYTGQIQDFDTTNMQLYFYNARYYDPALARFTQADTIVPQPENPQSLNRYSYVLNNPLNYTDPSGHYACSSHEKDAADNNFCYGVEILPGFSEAEIALIILTLHEYAAFLGGEQAFFDNVTASLDTIWKDVTLANNAFYNYKERSIRIGVNYLGSDSIGELGGKGHVAGAMTMYKPRELMTSDFGRNFFAGKFTETWIFGIPNPFSLKQRPIFGDALAVKNGDRPNNYDELLADAVAAYIYQTNGLSNGNYDAWIKEVFPMHLQ